MPIDFEETVDITDVNDEIWFDIINRTITPKDDTKMQDILVQNDANSRNLCFMIQRYFEDEDLSTKNIRVHFVNSLNQHDYSNTHSLEIRGDTDEVLSFKWLIDNKVCVETGNVKFAIEFYDSDTGYDLFTKPTIIKVEEGIYTVGEIEVSDWYKSFRDELEGLKETKADKTYVDGELDKKADKTDVYKLKAETKTSIEKLETNKANKEYVDKEFNKKENKIVGGYAIRIIEAENEGEKRTVVSVDGNQVVDRNQYNAEMANKADLEYVNNELGNKADKTYVDEAHNRISGNAENIKMNTNDIEGLRALVSDNIDNISNNATAIENLQENKVDESSVDNLLSKTSPNPIANKSVMDGLTPIIEILKLDGIYVVGVASSSIDANAFENNTDIKKASIADSVTTINENAFYGCSLLTNIILPINLTNIGDYAFFDCTSLTSITIPDGVTSIGDGVFNNCKSLTSITIPNSITSIGDSAFSNTGYYNNEENWENNVLYIGNYLISAGYYYYNEDTGEEKHFEVSGDYNIKDGTKLIASNAFNNCTSLTSITIPNSVISIGNSVFEYCTSLTSITIPNSVTSIGDGAFNNCTSLTSITISDSVTSIGANVFYNCKSLTSINVDEKNIIYCDIDGVLFNKDNTELIQYPSGKTDTSYTIPNSVTSIGDYAFRYCKSLTSITIPDSVTSIGVSVFEYCTSLTSITIPNSVISIGDKAFNNCTSLTSITISDNVTSIGDYAFRGTPLTSITIPNSVTSIGTFAFSGCKSLTSITIPNSVISIDNSAFNGCTSLTNVTIPNSVTSINNSTFRDCKSLTSITIPDGVTSIGTYAFSGCKSLTSITIPNSVISIGNNAFNGCTSLTNVTIGSDFNAKLNISSGRYTSDVMVAMFNNLKDLTGDTAKTLTLGSTNLAKLTAEQKAIATNKNWNLA